MSEVHRRDLIGIFAQHRVASNLLMIVMILLGTLALNRLNTQFFPTFALDVVNVRIEWRGASAEDVEDAITRQVEQELRSVDFVKKMTSTSSYGMSVVNLEFYENTDMGPVLDQVKDKVAQLRNLPTESEIPEVTLVTRYESVARILLSTDGKRQELRELAQHFERELLDRGISRVNITGLPEEEMAIQLSNADLSALGMSFDEVANRIAMLSQDLPAGEIGNNEAARQLRSLDQRRTEQAFAELPLQSDFNGGLLKLGDIADIERRPLRNQVALFHEGRPAVELELQRAENADSLKSARILENWLNERQQQLPSGVHMQVYDASWQLIAERINLLLKNGLGGLVLVLATLFLFLHGRVAFWVAVGIPVSFMTALFVLYLLGGSINMISLFGLIMALGIIVDDAIVVGEDSFTHYQKGEGSLTASEGGARRMLAPVLSSSLTTIASFIPLMLISGVIGNILFDIPFVVICVIIASLIECFLILPGHLRHSFLKMHHTEPSNFRRRLDNGFDYIREQLFRPAVTSAVKNRWITVSIALSMLILAVGLLVGGRISFTFFPSPEGTTVLANARFVAGTPQSEATKFLQHLNESLDAVRKELPQDVVELAVSKSGTAETAGGMSSGQNDERFVSMQLELISPDQREMRNQEFINHWREQIQIPAGMETFTISERRGGPPGSDIDVRLSGADAPTLKQAAQDVARHLTSYAGVSAIEDDMPFGQEQLIYQINGQGAVMGLTVDSVGRQLRAAFDGQLVQIFQDGDDEVEVRVMLPEIARNTQASLEQFQIQLPNGSNVPLGSVVDLSSQRGFDVLRHTNAQLAVHVTASVDASVNNNNRILADLEANYLPQLMGQYGIQYAFEGRAEEQADTLTDMRHGVILAFALIYIVLAWVFASYGWPLVVMTAIPFGLIGAVTGHWLMGLDLTILSLFGIFGLAGIVVNNAIILVTFFKELRQQGFETDKAIVEAAVLRLRAVLLTSLTTIGGLGPLLFETSRQAQFLIPMAVSISFGLMFATVLVLLVIPALLSIHESAAGKLMPERN
ncbi:efflux RND transporter permease subunit [Methylophaga sp. OBS3]|uniref:efflux RND transporter permease subunit n=1 Tax=Methylophaga sp. OBS3 TaxID=2991934 RepID=UPI00225A5FEE|nr:efflux RND transporter permease subunit [Methylophaga sp. OBS3]MCX4189220.1 efflux RND transporter permease subunit [Methylophaga sp. OBS3]